MPNTIKIHRAAVAFAAGASIFCAGQAFAADLAVTMTGPGSFQAGAVRSFVIHPTNFGSLPLPAGIVTKVTDTLPARLVQAVPTSFAGWNCSASTPTMISCTTTLGRTASQPFPDITFTAKGAGLGAYTDCATISFTPNAATQPDQVASNNTGCVSGYITPNPR